MVQSDDQVIIGMWKKELNTNVCLALNGALKKPQHSKNSISCVMMQTGMTGNSNSRFQQKWLEILTVDSFLTLQ